MNVLLPPQPPFFSHPHDSTRRSPTRSMSPFHSAMPGSKKRKADDDGDEMSVSPLSSPAHSTRQLAPRPSKKIRANELAGRPLTLPRLLETLDATQLRTVLQTICEREPQIGEEVVRSAPRPSVECALQVLGDYQKKLGEAVPYGDSSSDYTYYRVKQPLQALIDALTDFTPQFLPPNETQVTLSLQYLDGATKIIHSLPEWASHSNRHHKENAYDEISKAWALVINEASKRGAGFILHSEGWDQTLAKHNQHCGGRLQAAVQAMASNVGWVGGGPASPSSGSSNQGSILDQLMSGNYGSPVRVGPCIANPFEEPKQRVSEFTATEIATLQSRLEKQLGPEYLSARSGPSGQKVHYIAAEKCIALANEVFGFNGWSSSIQNIQVDFVDENPQTLKISLGLSVIVRVTLRDGTYHEDIGYGHIENCKGKAAAFEKAKKEGTTDALKRTLRNFGNVLGNCIYDKDYLSKVTKIKVAPTKFDEDNLHRHADYVKKEPAIKVEPSNGVNKNGAAKTNALAEADVDAALDADFGDFDMADFGVVEDGHPDEVVLPGSHHDSGGANSANSRRPSTTAFAGNGSDRSSKPPPPGRPLGQPPRPPNTPNQAPPRPSVPRPNPQQPPRPPSVASSSSRMNTPPPNVARPPNGANPPNPSNGAVPEASFFSARAVRVEELPKDPSDKQDDAPAAAVVLDPNAKAFDPHMESPSIRKTPGIDHRSSKPLARNGVHVPPAAREQQQQPNRVPNPSLRQIGAPGAGGSPLANRGQYRPPTMKRPAGPADRAPLAEVATNSPAAAAAAGAVGVEAKRQKMG
ncbi:hypothetical protein F4780DRAFT_771586 [Xylariomycetidae sp. FL0641]|nr:hypothetical protein F4780DRAFT_771586 [Xylariomycetidae sp. FL0641]